MASIPRHRYTAALANEIETRWQDRWEERGTFEAPNPAGPLADPARIACREQLYVLDMFPYPSGAGLHVGHPLGYIGTDVFGRFKRATGHNVLHALGYDAFGLPAEQHAIATGVHPRVNTEANVATMRRQLRRLGLAHDARRSISTTDEAYYRWTQWIFLRIFGAWYDEDAHRARPIRELVAEYEAGSRPTGAAPWAELTAPERVRLVNSRRLAYLADAPVNWCPGLGTILANEEVTAEGRSDIGNYPVFTRTMRQWTMRITAYADRLLDDLDRLDWPESIKLMQRNWIGRSRGARVRFASAAGPIEVFTTRPDTLFGATFMVLAPEHPLVDALTAPEQRARVAVYRAATRAATDAERASAERPKTGVALGATAVNPVSGAPIPVWIADYVLTGYGTGAIMAVPSGDQRDFEFARAHDLPIAATQMPPDAWFAERGIAPTADCTAWPEAFVGEGTYVGSRNDTLVLDGLGSIAEASARTTAWLEGHGLGAAATTYKLRDWLFSRQRYWGEPFPIVYGGDGEPLAVPDEALPVRLPELVDFTPQALAPDDERSEPAPPLSRVADWVEVDIALDDPISGERRPRARYRREVNVMPQWAGSCWYELRYLDPTNDARFVDAEVERYWMGPRAPGHTGGVALYVGGVEHAVLHLLYARFWHKVLHDLGHVASEEPFHRLFNQGYIQAPAYHDARGQAVPADEVVERDGAFFHGAEPVAREYGKIGKSLKNVVTPDEMYEEFGADTFRLYEMSMGPLDASRPWNTRDVVGMQRFLQRVWRNAVDEDTGAVTVTDAPADDDLRRALHRTIAGVRDDMEGLHFNTAIAKLIELNNALTLHAGARGAAPREVMEPLVQMLAPLCPHLACELWERLGRTEDLTYAPFPVADPAWLATDTIEVPVQVNGKVRARVVAPAGADDDALRDLALADERVRAALGGAAPRKVIVVPGRLVNLVV